MERVYKILTIALIVYAILGIGRLIMQKFERTSPTTSAVAPMRLLA